jgi:hypothetical protein
MSWKSHICGLIVMLQPVDIIGIYGRMHRLRGGSFDHCSQSMGVGQNLASFRGVVRGDLGLISLFHGAFVRYPASFWASIFSGSRSCQCLWRPRDFQYRAICNRIETSDLLSTAWKRPAVLNPRHGPTPELPQNPPQDFSMVPLLRPSGIKLRRYPAPQGEFDAVSL